MTLGSKLFNFATPYHRVFLLFSAGDEIFTLPGINTALTIVSNGDSILIEDVEDVDKCVFFDFQLINDRESKFKNDFDRFKEFVKKQIFIKKQVAFIITNRVLLPQNLVINCKMIENE